MSGQLGKRAVSVAYMFALGAVAAGLLAGVKVATSAQVADNQRFAASANLVRAFELAEITPKTTGADLAALIEKNVREYWVVTRDGRQVVTDRAPALEEVGAYHLWVELDASGRPAAYAFPIGGQGFWGPIEGIASVGPDGQTLRTVVWTRHGETPGLGARIEEDGYRAKFRGRRATSDFTIVPEGTMGEDPDKVDAITGATQTTVVGLGAFLPKNFARWQEVLPLVRGHLNAGGAAESSAG